jgi:transcriptional regulator with XRE-family HTH domain
MARVGGKPREGDLTPERSFGLAVARTRGALGLSQQQLTEKLSELGYMLPRESLARLETGKRGASLADVLAIAYALDVSPLHLMVPIDDSARLIVVGAVQPADADDLRSWIRGEAPLLSQDPRVFHYVRPRAEIEAERAEIDAVRIGVPTSSSAFFTRQALAALGLAEPITKEEENKDG